MSKGKAQYMSQNDLSNRDFHEILESLLEVLSPEDSPITRQWVRLMLSESQGLDNAGQEMTVKRMISTLPVTLAKIEQDSNRIAKDS
jgi:hypothetical protein